MPPFSSFLPNSSEKISDSPEKTREDFSFYKRALEKYGVFSGTAHKRILIPKYDLTREEIEKQLGFIPVRIAIPESGQKVATSYRNPDNPYHLHEFEKYWTMHRDEHPASTMIAHKKIEAGGHPISSQITSFFSGLPHIITEGLPGLYYYTKGLISDVPSMDVRLLSELPEQYLRKMSGRDDPYNTIEGMRHGGMAGELRRRNTDFGSGYQGENREVRSAAAGIGTGAFSYFALKNAITLEDKLSISKYPRVSELREIGKKYGYAMIHTAQNKEAIEGLKGTKGLIYNRDIYPTDPLFRDLLKTKDWKWPENIMNFGSWDIGTEKLKTYEYFKQKGLGSMFPKTWNILEFTSMGPQGGFYEALEEVEKGKILPLDVFHRNPHLQEFMKDKNFVFKENLSALQKGVWFDLQDIPRQKMEEMIFSPEAFHIQERLPLKGEFRAITVGGKTVFSAHRWGGPEIESILSKFKGINENLYNVIREQHLSENIVPIGDTGLERRLSIFAEKAHAALPKGLDIAAWDIGLTEKGELKIIEMQRMFGTIKNPLVQERIESLLTGKLSARAQRFMKIAPAALGVLGAGVAYNLFSGRKDAGNTIEGMPEKGWAAELRKEGTDFGSPWGSTWKGWFGGISRKISKYMASGTREGATPLLHPKEAARLAKGSSLEEFAKSLNEDIVILSEKSLQKAKEDISKAHELFGKVSPDIAEESLRKAIRKEGDIKWLMERESKSPAGSIVFEGGRRLTYIDPNKLQTSFLAEAQKSGISKELISKVAIDEDLSKVALYHEILENQSMLRFKGKAKMDIVTKVGKDKVRIAHHSGQVIFGEAAFVKELGNKNVQDFFKLYRKSKVEEPIFLAGLDAFGETGVNAKLRKLTTDFGEYRNSAQIVKQNIIERKIKFNKTAETLKRSQYMIWNNAKYGARNHVYQQGK